MSLAAGVLRTIVGFLTLLLVIAILPVALLIALLRAALDRMERCG